MNYRLRIQCNSATTLTAGHCRSAFHLLKAGGDRRGRENILMSSSTIFLFGAIMYLIGLGGMLFKDEVARLGSRLRKRT